MCYDDAARPPEPAGAKGSATGEDLVLTASDGNRFLAYLATPSQPSEAQMIVYPDVRGLHQFYKELALRFAEVGIKALAIDYFGRTAGLTSRDESFEYMPHVQQLDMDKFTLDVQAALNNLRQGDGAGKPIFVVGFCMGGSLAFMTGTNPDLGFAGLLPFYAGLSRDRGGKGNVLQNANRVRYPVLAQFGGDDQGIPQTEIDQLDQSLDTAGIEHQIVVYPGAPHSFFDRRFAEFAKESAKAWERMLEFIAKHKVPVAT